MGDFREFFTRKTLRSKHEEKSARFDKERIEKCAPSNYFLVSFAFLMRFLSFLAKNRATGSFLIDLQGLAGPEREFFRRAGRDFDDIFCRTARIEDVGIGRRQKIVLDVDDPETFIEPDDVEREFHAFHPESVVVRRWEGKEHAGRRGKIGYVAEALLLRRPEWRR